MSGFFVNYAVIVTVPLVGKLKVMRNDCRIDWIIFNNSWMAKLASWCPGVMHFPMEKIDRQSQQPGFHGW